MVKRKILIEFPKKFQRLKRVAQKTVTKTNPTGKTKVIKEGKPRIFDVEPTYLSYKLGTTFCPRQYESCRIDLGISMPCLPEEIDATFKLLVIEVETRLEEQTKKWMKKLQCQP